MPVRPSARRSNGAATLGVLDPSRPPHSESGVLTEVSSDGRWAGSAMQSAIQPLSPSQVAQRPVRTTYDRSDGSVCSSGGADQDSSRTARATASSHVSTNNREIDSQHITIEPISRKMIRPHIRRSYDLTTSEVKPNLPCEALTSNGEDFGRHQQRGNLSSQRQTTSTVPSGDGFFRPAYAARV